ncbi:MAG: hypothetical protein V8Q40_16595 [Anaerosacchariphilus sp.]
MIETTVLDYLSDKLDVPVYMEEPEKPPKQYVIIEKTGSGRKNYINSAMLALAVLRRDASSGGGAE